MIFGRRHKLLKSNSAAATKELDKIDILILEGLALQKNPILSRTLHSNYIIPRSPKTSRVGIGSKLNKLEIRGLCSRSPDNYNPGCRSRWSITKEGRELIKNSLKTDSQAYKTMAKHVGYYLENVSEEFAKDLQSKLQDLDINDCLGLLEWLQARIKEQVKELSEELENCQSDSE